MIPRDSIVNDLQNLCKLRRIDFFIFASNMQGSDSKGLQFTSLELGNPYEGFVNYSNCNEQSLRPHSEFVMQLSKPIDQIFSVPLINEFWVFSFLGQIICWIHMTSLLIFHIDNYFIYEFNNTLRISHFKNIGYIKISSDSSPPILSSFFKLGHNSFKFFLVKRIRFITSFDIDNWLNNSLILDLHLLIFIRNSFLNFLKWI